MSLKSYILAAGNIVESLVYLLMGIALLIFFWGLARFVYKAGDAKAVEEGRNLMIWGLIALFVMTSVWGLISLISGELNISSSGGLIPVR